MTFHTNNLLMVVLIVLLIPLACSNQELDAPPSEQVLQKCLDYSQYTNPGALEHLYDNLPTDMADICKLIKTQLIHPFDIEKFADTIPKERAYEDRAIPTVELMLQELLDRDSNGLVASRNPEDRLVVACVHHSLLLASILRHQGIPVCLRAGNAKYIGTDKRVRVSHVICEVWDAQRKVWFLVDPDRNKIDFDRQEFEFAGETWQKLRNKTLEKRFYVSRYKSVDQAAAHLVWLDLSCVTGAEEPYWNDPPLVTKINDIIADLSDSELQLLDKIASFLQKTDQHFSQLMDIKASTSSLSAGRE